MGLFDLFKPKATQPSFVLVGACPAPGQLPEGFFRVEARGRETLGWSGTWFSYDVGRAVNDHGKTITLSAFLDERKHRTIADLPLVRLNFTRQTPGVMQANGRGLLDTDAMPGDFDGNVGYSGVNAPRREGFDFI